VKYKTEKVKFVKSAFHTLFCMVSMVSILLKMQKKYTSENDPLQAQITMREFQFFESIIQKLIIIVVYSISFVKVFQNSYLLNYILYYY
jgi:hypothetical protein